MAIALDAVSTIAADTGTLSWTHTPVDAPDAIIVCIMQDSEDEEVDIVTYGGVQMSDLADGAPAPGAIPSLWFIYYLLDAGNIPVGPQTVEITVSDASSKTAVCYSLSSDPYNIIDGSFKYFTDDSLADPSDTLPLGGVDGFVFGFFHSGHSSVSDIAPLAGWTSDHEVQFAAACAGFYHYDTVAADDVTVGWTQTAEDCNGIFYSMKENGEADYAAPGWSSPTWRF